MTGLPHIVLSRPRKGATEADAFRLAVQADHSRDDDSDGHGQDSKSEAIFIA
jgi:hypothetical protein